MRHRNRRILARILAAASGVLCWAGSNAEEPYFKLAEATRGALVQPSGTSAEVDAAVGARIAAGSLIEPKTGGKIRLAVIVDGQEEEIYEGEGALRVPQASRYWVVSFKNDVRIHRLRGGQVESPRVNRFLYPGDRIETGLNSQAVLYFDKVAFPLNELGEVQAPAAEETGFFANLKKGAAKLFKHWAGNSKIRIGNSVAGIVNTDVLVQVNEDDTAVVASLDGKIKVFTNLVDGVIVPTGWQAEVSGTNILRLENRSLSLTNRELIAWTLHYPLVLDPKLIRASPEIETSLRAYERGEVVEAFQAYPSDRRPTEENERAFLAVLYLGVGQYDRASNLLSNATASSQTAAVQMMIAAVKGEAAPPVGETSSEWLAKSYYEQAQGRLPEAREAALRAIRVSGRFGFAWSQLAELEFSFGRIAETEAAVQHAIECAPNYAPNYALKGFVQAAKNNIDQAIAEFDAALRLDGSLASAWLGRGMCLLRKGYLGAGRQNLLVAASLEPLEPIYLSYLAKAHSEAGNDVRAMKELDLAMTLDPSDPTAPLYRALIEDRQYRPNSAIKDLENSLSTVESRRTFRSSYLLDQDRAVRGATLARIYSQAGLADWSVGVAAKAVARDYDNSSAQFFLSQSYSHLQSAGRLDPRFEPAVFGGYLIGNLLAPVGAGQLSETVSQQEYSKLFERDGFGVFSETQYRSSGDWIQSGSQYGRSGNFEYALDGGYLSLTGDGPNADIEQRLISFKVKQQIGPSDSLLIMVSGSETESGDSRQRYDPNLGLPGRYRDRQEPNLIVGYHHQWQPGSDSLVAISRLSDLFNARGALFAAPFIPREADGRFAQTTAAKFEDIFSGNLNSDFAITGIEAQHLWRADSQWRPSIVAGAFYQDGDINSEADLVLNGNSPNALAYDRAKFARNTSANLLRASGYAYFSISPVSQLDVTVGVSYDFLRTPSNADFPPLAGKSEIERDLVSPKVGLIWQPTGATTVRGAFARSLGGQYFENSVRLEPAQIAGFVQRFRSLAPSAVAGAYPGSEFQNASVALDQKVASSTFISISGEWLESKGARQRGSFDYLDLFPFAAQPGQIRQEHNYRERAAAIHVNQLIGSQWSFGAGYRVAHAELEQDFDALPAAEFPGAHTDWRSLQHEVTWFGQFTHQSGFFASGQGLWVKQDNDGSNVANDDVLQIDAFVGYRFLRGRGRVVVGLLNLTDADYRLWPLNAYPDLPRQRTLITSLRLSF